MNFLAVFASGLLFGLGLGISGMTNPWKIIGFLDFFGNWNPDLLFVMIGAIPVYGTCYIFINKREKPVLEPKFFIPTKKIIDKPLIIGSAIFGLGWGIGGYCPGPAFTSLATMSKSAITIVSFTCLGVAIYQYIFKPIWMKG